MKMFQKLSLLMSLLFLVSAIPTMAQTDNQVTFETSFPFYAGDTKMPAGNYTMTPDDIAKTILIKSADGSHSVFVEYELVEPDPTPSKTEVSFNKYGATDFLGRISIVGNTYGMQILPSRAEQDAAKDVNAEQHSLSPKSGQ